MNESKTIEMTTTTNNVNALELKNKISYPIISERPHKIIWFNVMVVIVIHSIGSYGLFLAFTEAHYLTILQLVILHVVAELGITAGLHRLWTHRSYKAKWPLRLILMLAVNTVFMGTIYRWCRDHRLHHKHSDTIADPHNINNGFFFAHIGWLMSKKYPEVTDKCEDIDMDDIINDPIAEFQRKHIRSLVILLGIILPTIIPMILWKESFICAFCVNMLRYLISLHFTLSVNSVAHLLGQKPYNKNIHPVENKLLSMFVMGEGFHNYHHSFPWDYKTAELGGSAFNLAALLIELFAKIGWAYDLKTTSPTMVKNLSLKSGDGSHAIWGWGDKDQSPENIKEAKITFRKEDKHKLQKE